MKRLFFDVDTQNDFISESGALSVPGANSIRPNLKKLTAYARDNSLSVFGSVDRHFGEDAHKHKESELARWGGPFPDHCMSGSKGQDKIPETAPKNPAFIQNRKYPKEELDSLTRGKREVYFEKQTFNVFDNPCLKLLADPFGEVVLYGVATDYCILAAALGFRKMGKSVTVVTDAIKAVDLKVGDGERALEKMRKEGVQFATTKQVLSR